MKRVVAILLFLVLNGSILAGSDDKKLFSLYPVPLKTAILRVKLNNSYFEPLTIELRNLIGRKLQEKTFPVGSDEISFQDMDSYPNGIYVVLAKDAYGKIIESTKFVIEK